METITVRASGESCVRIGSGLLQAVGSSVRLLGAKSAVLVCDSNVAPLYAAPAAASLRGAGVRTELFTFPAGEASKTPETWLALVRFLARHRLTRTDAVVALGGGVTGDLAGFAAASYLRGVPFVQLPTTLLAMIDSSVGGKTAVDLPEGKNLLGAFCQPRLVLCDPDALATLPRSVLTDGCGELVKYAVLHDPALLRALRKDGTDAVTEAVIARCVRYKRDLVEKDEFDRGDRRLLNLGHTLGHAVEAAGGYTVPHGSAVAIGLASVARAAAKAGICTETCAAQIAETLRALGLPTRSPYPAEALLPWLSSDKKRTGASAVCIVPRMVGRCETYTATPDALAAFLEAGL